MIQNSRTYSFTNYSATVLLWIRRHRCFVCFTIRFISCACIGAGDMCAYPSFCTIGWNQSSNPRRSFICFEHCGPKQQQNTVKHANRFMLMDCMCLLRTHSPHKRCEENVSYCYWKYGIEHSWWILCVCVCEALKRGNSTVLLCVYVLDCIVCKTCVWCVSGIEWTECETRCWTKSSARIRNVYIGLEWGGTLNMR